MLWLLAAPSVGGARAAPLESPEDTTAKGQAQELLAEGNRLAHRGEFVGALKRYRAAFELFQSPNLLLNIGTSLRHLGRDAEAATVYEAYIAHPEADPKVVATVQGLLTEIDGLVAQLTIALNVPDALLHVDGRVLTERAARTTVRVDPGEHTIVAEKDSLQPVVRSVTVSAGERRTVELSLVAKHEAPVDGSAQRIVAYSMGGLALAGLGVGAVFGGLFLSSKAEADEHCDAVRCDPAGADAVVEAQDRGQVANVAFVASGILAAGAVVVFFTAPSDEPEVPEPAISLLVGGRGIELDWRW